MTKEHYRSFFVECKLFIKMNYFCKIAGIDHVNLSRFLKGSEYNWCLSIDKCKRLYDTIMDHLEKIA